MRSTEAEDQVVRAITKAAALVRAGTGPNDALVAAAREEQLPPALIKLAINAYNTGRTNTQRKESADPFGKSADFELADPARIISAIYPAEVKTAAARHRESAVSGEYDAPPDFGVARRRTKLAAAGAEPDPAPPAYPRDPNRFERRTRGALEKVAAARAEFARELDELCDKVAADVAELDRYFRTPGHLPPADVRANAAAAFGPGAAVLVDKVAGTACDGKPTKVRLVTTKMDRYKAPYKTVEAALTSARAHAEKLAAASAFETEAVRLEFELGRALLGNRDPLPPDLGLSVVRRLAGEKRAFIGSTFSGGAQFALGNQMAGSLMKRLSPDPDDKVKQDAYTSLLDPSHEAKLKAIRTQAVLHEVMQSPYFEGEDPAKVMVLYNNLNKLMPRAAEQPMVLEAAMRQLMAQGQADPHGLDQYLGIENKLKSRDELPTGSTGLLQAMAPSLGGGGGGKKDEE